MVTPTTPLRWGFVSTADIGNTNASGIKQSTGSILHTVTSRHMDKAEQFKQKHGFQHAGDSYDALLTNPDIDILYIPTPTTHRAEFAIKAAQHGKHMLIEKPVAANAKQLRNIIEECVKHKVILLDGVMFMHHPRLCYLRSVMSDTNTFGTVRHVHCSFSFPGMQDAEYVANNIRLDPSLEPLGALGDLAWYTIRFTLFCFAYQTPLTVACNATYYDRTTNKYTYTAQHSKDELRGVMTELSCLMTFADGATATFHSSFNSQGRQLAEVTGTLQSIRMTDYVIPNDEKVATFDIHRQSVDADKGESRREDAAVEHTHVKVHTRQPQHVHMINTIHKLITVGGQRSAHSNSTTPRLTDRFNKKDVSIDADTDAQLQSLKQCEYNRISWANVALLTQAVCDSVVSSSYNGGQPTKVQYKAVDNSA